ncbi:MAG: transcriptional regulator of acetoin/glycerol metabolism [Celeribacter sp.]|jgi:transcriptional regulator of acetoin/glycerol metabolism
MKETERHNFTERPFHTKGEIDDIRKSRGLSGTPELPDLVSASWKRCLEDYKLLPDTVPRAEVLTHSQLREIMGTNEEFLRIAEPEMERLFSRLVDSEYLVSIASSHGAMLLFRCDYKYLGDLASLGVLPGSIWTEDRQGTNGIGTCLSVGKSVAIVGEQHFGEATQSLTCLTSPIFGSNGTIESVINVTTARQGDDRMNAVVKNIVERSSRRIENGYFGRVHKNTQMIRITDSAENSDIAEEGRLALDDNGRIIDGSSHVARLIGQPAGALFGARADEVFDFDTKLENIRPDQSFDFTFKGKLLKATISDSSARKTHLHSIMVPDGGQKARAKSSPIRIIDGKQKELRMEPVLSQAINRAQRLLASGLSVVLSGETGVGKTVFAQKIAQKHVGAEGQVVAIDCASLKSDADINGLLRLLAAGQKSCLLLDRIDELNEQEQVSVLRLLEHAVSPDVQNIGVVSVSSQDVDEFGKTGAMRKDLLHRLKGGHVSFAPLRNTPNLADTILDFFKLESKNLGREHLEIDPQVKRIFENYHWPGNVRELRKTLRHAIALADGNTIRLEHLPVDIVEEFASQDMSARSQSEASKIEAALRYNKGNVSMTARYLGVSRATLYRKIEIQKARSEN